MTVECNQQVPGKGVVVGGAGGRKRRTREMLAGELLLLLLGEGSWRRTHDELEALLLA